MRLTDLCEPKGEALSKIIPVAFTAAALEQHGRTSPSSRTSLLCGDVLPQASERPGGVVPCASPQWLGNSKRHMDLGGAGLLA